MYLYKLFCNIYSILIFKIENILYRQNKIHDKTLENYGIKKLELNKGNLLIGEEKKSIKINKYHYRSIYSNKDINLYLENFFDKELKNEIRNLTGFNYSIDYFGAYKNFPISESDIHKGYFANHYHFDKPYSKNMLKVFVTMSEVNKKDGPLEIINKNESKAIKKGKKNINNVSKYYFTGEKGDVLLFKPNLCFHKAGNPNKGNYTYLIMLQLNPSINWQISKYLYKRQFKIEPKFTSLINLLSRDNKFKTF